MAEEKKLLNVSSNPHVRDKITTRTIMLLVLLALLPATGYGVYHFGLYSLAIVLVTTGSAVIWEKHTHSFHERKNPPIARPSHATANLLSSSSTKKIF